MRLSSVGDCTTYRNISIRLWAHDLAYLDSCRPGASKKFGTVYKIA